MAGERPSGSGFEERMNDHHRSLVRELERMYADGDLDDWQEGFAESVFRAAEEDRCLTPSQAETLLDIVED